MAQFIERDGEQHDETTMPVQHFGDALPTERGYDDQYHPEAFLKTKSGFYVDAL